MLTNELLNVISKKAVENNIEPALLLAVIDTESSGTPFWNIDGVDHPIVRFEGHYFYARLKGDVLQRAIKEGLASKKVGGVLNPSTGKARYELIARAEALDETAAIESCSWGLGQVMGANWKDLGYNSAKDLMLSAATVDGQVDMIIRFLNRNGLMEKLRKKDWKGFASGYNGSSYRKNAYDKKLGQAYQKYLNPQTNDVINAPVDEILLVQKMLNEVGGYQLLVDGKLGISTNTALRDFQLKNGLVVDGKYGTLTKAALENAYVAKSQKATHQFGAGAAGLGMAGTALTEGAKQIQQFTGISTWIQVAFVAMVVVGVALTAYTMFFKKG
jgi:hypothetical protein